MKALVIVVSILNSAPDVSTYVQGFMNYEDCMFMKKVAESGPLTVRQIAGVKVTKERVICQPMMQEDFDRFEKSFRKN